MLSADHCKTVLQTTVIGVVPARRRAKTRKRHVAAVRNYEMKTTKAIGAIFAAALLTACEVTTVSTGPIGPATPAAQPSRTGTLSPSQAARSFVQVVRTVEPIAERECRARTSGVNCNFNIVVDDRPGQPANAFQTLDKQGRPIVAFTLALIADARNEDELAFVLGHETAHHIAGHIGRQQQNAVAGAVVAGGLAVLLGGDNNAVEAAQRTGAQVGARSYSKNFELEADALGTIITARAGYDPLRGAQFFARIPDPGDRFLGTHPPNASRLDTVRRTAAGL
jgi:predicted Zn-dependent protease